MIVTLLRKPLTGTTLTNLIDFQGGGMNIDACRVATGDSFSLKSGDTSGLCGTNDVWTKPWKTDSAGLVRRQIAMLEAVSRANTLGRFPANLLHTGDSTFMGLIPSHKEPSQGENSSRGNPGSVARFFKAVTL